MLPAVRNVCVCVCGCTGMRSGISEVDFSAVLSEEVEEEVRQAAEISMGTEVKTPSDDQKFKDTLNLCSAHM